jgi:recombination protein RecT
MSEQQQQPQQALTTKNLFAKDEVRGKFQEMLGKRATSFITSVLQIVASNKLLAKAEPHSVYHAAAAAATLDLPLNNNLGFAYIVPYNESVKDSLGQWKKVQVAQFQMGYKGFIQLAQRSGQYRLINAVDVREGELIGKNLLTGEMVFKWEQDEEKRDALPIIGYVSYFELLNGFSKIMFMSVKKLKAHAKKYSKTYQQDKGQWIDNFDGMSLKTVLKLNISKYGPLSVDMQKAITFDQGVIKDTDTMDVTYADGTGELAEDAEDAPEEITYEELQKLYDENFPILGAQLNKDAKRIIERKEVDSYAKLAIEIQKCIAETNTEK